MKLLAVSDLHFGRTQFDWVTQQAGRYAAVIIAGDLLDLGGHLDLDSQITVVTKYLRTISTRTRLLVCSGTHDGDEKNEHQEYTARWLQRVRAAGLAVDGGSASFDGLHVSICPWWDGPATRETMERFLHAESTVASGRTWLWVHHAPPDGVGVSWDGKGHLGDPRLVETIHKLQPDLVFSGHIHNSPFRDGGAWAARLGRTWVFNPGKQLGVPPAFIELDLAQRTARWSSQAGDEQISLADLAQAPA